MIDELASRIKDHRTEINEFVSEELEKGEVPIYSSFDLRNSGYKISAVDPNVYPAGFNNICQQDLRSASTLLEQIIRKRFGNQISTICLYTEDHTKNVYYFQNLYSLLKLFEDTGFDTKLVSTNEELDGDPATLETAQRDEIEVYQLHADGTGLTAGGEELDLVISNNDFSAGVPELLEQTSVPVTPPPAMGWWNRKKWNHFQHSRDILETVSEMIGVDPWRFVPVTEHVESVDFHEQENFESVAESIDRVIERTREKFREYEIDETPYAFVKSDQGTYGMGVYSFESGEEFLDINRDQRDSMARRKGGGENTSLIVQEGIPTEDRVADFVAEPVIYCLEHRPVGGFLRTNEEQSDRDNLNTRGMDFTSEDLCTLFVDDPEKNEGSNITQAKVDLYKLLATLGTLACAREISELGAEAV
jgi:glutamate--cysteine ligase